MEVYLIVYIQAFKIYSSWQRTCPEKVYFPFDKGIVSQCIFVEMYSVLISMSLIVVWSQLQCLGGYWHEKCNQISIMMKTFWACPHFGCKELCVGIGCGEKKWLWITYVGGARMRLHNFVGLYFMFMKLCGNASIATQQLNSRCWAQMKISLHNLHCIGNEVAQFMNRRDLCTLHLRLATNH